MSTFLAIAFAVLAGLFYLHRRRNRAQWRRVAKILEALNSGTRPTTFILHGEAPIPSIGIGLETLGDQRDRLVRQISQEEFNLQTILSSMTEGVMVVDTERRVRLVNSPWLHGFDLKTSPIGQSVLQAVRNATVDEMIRQALNTGRAESRELTLPAGGRHLAMSAAPIRDSSGTILGVAAIAHDVTRVRQLEQIRREFVANVSHELRTPLSIFQGYLEMLLENPEIPREELDDALRILQRHSSRLNLLVEDLLNLARLESRREEFNLVPVDVDTLLHGVADDWKLKFAGKKVRLRLETTPGLPPVMAEELRLEQVMSNLLANALKYTPEEGEVAIHAEFIPAGSDKADGDASPRFGEIEIRVRDSGSGIPPADLPHIFERFYRADKARSREMGGTGLGLSIVKHIIQGHGGSVRAESVYGRGTTVLIRLPAAPLIAENAVPQRLA